MPKVTPVSPSDYLINQVNNFTPGKTAEETTDKIITIISTFQTMSVKLSLKDQCKAIEAFKLLQTKEIKHYRELKNENCPYTAEVIKTDLITIWMNSIIENEKIDPKVKSCLKEFSTQEKEKIIHKVHTRINKVPFFTKLLCFSKSFPTLFKEEVGRILLIKELQILLIKTQIKINLEEVPISKLQKIKNIISEYNLQFTKKLKYNDNYTHFLRRWNTIIAEKVISGDEIVEGSIFRDIYFGKKVKEEELLNELCLANIFYSSVEFATKVSLVVGIQKLKSDLISMKVDRNHAKEIVKNTITKLRDTKEISDITAEDLEETAIPFQCDVLLKTSILGYDNAIYITNPLPNLRGLLSENKYSLQEKKTIIHQLFCFIKKIKIYNDLDQITRSVREEIENVINQSNNINEIVSGIEKIHTKIKNLPENTPTIL